MRRRFLWVDVFGARPMAGNPLAGMLDADDLSTDETLDRDEERTVPVGGATLVLGEIEA